MKVGILTLDKADNYGAVLQAYALQTVLSGLGLRNEIISKESQTKRIDEKNSLSGTAAIIMKRVRMEEDKRKALFQSFRDTYLHYSVQYTDETMDLCNQDYDCFIVGSDQIWNMYVKGADTDFFLPFADPSKRFSYAASFGGETLPDSIRDWATFQLKRFEGLSVREESGQQVIKELTGRDAVICLDPTLLLKKNDWVKLIQPSTIVENASYFLLYMLQYDDDMVMEAKNKAISEGARLVAVTSNFQPEFGFSSWSGVDVPQWIELVANAKGVYTNSFHGTIFSLIFNKPTRVFQTKGNLKNRNGRIVELLSKVDMTKCLSQLSQLPENQFEDKINPYVESSFGYLKQLLTGSRSLPE